MMISMGDIEKMSDYECINLICELVHRLKSTTYAHGYKDGFNDAKDAEFQNSLFMKSEESCDNCKHNTESWDSDACDGCCKANSNAEVEG